MITRGCSDNQDLLYATARWCEDKALNHKARSIFLPAGNTPLQLYKLWEETKPSYLVEIRFRQIDDIYNGQQKGYFRRFFEENLPSYINQLDFIGDQPQNSDLCVLGFGRNGHVAFHEPELSPQFNFGCVPLSTETRQHLKLEENTWGITYGVGSFLKSKAILLIISGDGKEEAYQAFKNRDPRIPASHLANHSDLTVLTCGYQ